MNKIILIVGGARSGKSSFAEKLARKLGKNPLYLAAAQAQDREMRARIRKHRQRRGNKWQLIEEPVNIERVVARISSRTEVILFDCVTVWLSNLILAGKKEREIKKKLKTFLNRLRKRNFHTILVSNEVGGGIVPANRLARDYRDLLGTVNQLLAKEAEFVYQLCCGIPLRIKGEENGKD